MKKLIFLLLSLLALVTSCEQNEVTADKPQSGNKGIVITDTQHDPQAQALLQHVLPSGNSARINNLSASEADEIYKYFDLENDNLSYSLALKDTSDLYFENLVVSKIGNDFYAFILRYIYSSDYVFGNNFEGTIERYNLDGDLIGRQRVPDVIGEPDTKAAKTLALYSCVTGYNVECHNEYQISTATGRPIPETLTTICVNKAVYGWCGDTAGPMPSPQENTGWGTYIPTSGSGTAPGSSVPPDNPDKAGNAGGIVPNQKSNPVVVVPDLHDQRVADFKRGLNSTDQLYLKKNPTVATVLYNYLESTVDDSGLTVTSEYDQDAKNFAQELLTLARLENNPELSVKILSISVVAKQQGYLNGRAFDQNFFSTIDPHVDLDLSTPDYNDPLTIHLMVKYQVLKSIHPEWSDAKVFWETVKDVVHMGLDLVGLVPVLGEGADLVNGVIYVLEGDGVNATLSFAAAVPGVGAGSTISKYALKIISVDLVTKVRLVWKVTTEGISFGGPSWCRKQLRQALGMATGDARQAHHIIPLNKQKHEVVQKAAQSKEAFHLNEALNGIPLDKDIVHLGSHPEYDKLIQGKLDTFMKSNPNATPDECYKKIMEIIQEVRTAIANNPNTPVNNLKF